MGDNPGTKAREERVYSNRTLPPRRSRRDPSMGTVIASLADAFGSTLKAGVVAPYMLAKEPTKKGLGKSVGKFNKIIRDSGKRAERRWHASQTNYPKRKRAKSKTKAVNTRLGGS